MLKAFSSWKSLSAGLTKGAAAVTLGAAVLVSAPTLAAANEKYAAFVIDANNGKVLFAENADAKRYPASLTKMMTLYMLFEALETGRAKLTTPLKVSAYAAGRPPSKLGLKVGSTISAEEAILSLVTRSANDASVVIGEYLGGTETQFAEMMTAKARKLGMSRTVFQNANGLPNPAQFTTARDMATLGIALREHFPQYYKYFSTRSFSFRGQTIGNHNRLLGRIKGVDGIKTGYINASGFNLVTSVFTGNKKLVAVVMGGRSGRSRDDHMATLVNRYLPAASTRVGSPLVASWSPGRDGRTPAQQAERVAASLPSTVPTPSPRMRPESIDQRVAMAYGTNAADAVNDAVANRGPRTVIGREALRAALVAPVRAPRMEIAAANALAPSGPVPRAAIPSATTLDSGNTGSIATTSGASPWIVQIAATPVQATALDMLSEAKRSVGGALASAQPYTEAVASGSQTLYRARFAGFATKAAANEACDALKRRSYACYAIAN